MTEPTMQPLGEAPAPSPAPHRFRRHVEPLLFWTLTLLYLAPIWSYPYIPTQDGPSHIANAYILKGHGSAAAGYENYFDLRREPLPNLTSHVLLAGLLYVFPPLVAEKLLVSLYVLGFAGGFRYFLGAFGDRCRPLSWLGLLFVYNRCLWMGFYNYCLCLVLFWIILGYCVRRRGALRLPHGAVLMVLFTVEYFTHLVGFLLAVGGALGASILVRPRRLLSPVVVCVAAVPALCLVMDYFERTGFFTSRASQRISDHSFAMLRGDDISERLFRQLDVIDRDIFEIQAGPHHAFSMYLLPFVIFLGLCTVAASAWHSDEERAGPGWLFPFLLGLVLSAIYVLAPQHLTSENGVLNHGGFIQSRVAVLPALVWLACLREPVWPGLRIPIRLLMVLLLGVNLLLVTRVVRSGNQEVEAYTAGIEAAGRGHKLFIIHSDRPSSPLVNPLLHAADYYCLGTDNVNLDNYEATTPHFPVKYHKGISRGEDDWSGYPNKDIVDVILSWDAYGGGRGPNGWKMIFHKGPLRLYGRK